MNKTLHRVDVVLYVMADDEFDACWVATNVRFESFECVAKEATEAKRLDPEWEEAVPYNADDDRTCSEILSSQRHLAQPRSTIVTKKRTDPNKTATPAAACALRQRAETKFRIAESQPPARLSPEDTLQVLHELQVHQIEL